jgi:hypothetical protein
MNEYSKASDVFSFGISLGQIFMGEEPEDMYRAYTQVSMDIVAKASLTRVMVGKVERVWSDNALALTVVGMAALVDIILDCLQHTTSSRPTMGVVAQRLCSVVE